MCEDLQHGGERAHWSQKPESKRVVLKSPFLLEMEGEAVEWSATRLENGVTQKVWGSSPPPSVFFCCSVDPVAQLDRAHGF